MAKYCVITGDIKGSRSLDDWPNTFKKLDERLKKINEEFCDDILIKFKPTTGDEFQGVLKSPKSAYNIYFSIKNRLPIEIYYGIGIGDVEIPFDKDFGTRGSAFYRARSALEWCKKKKREIFLKSSDTENQIDDVINVLLHFIDVLESSWTKRQREVVNYYRANQNYTYERVGKHFGISKQSISQILKAANWNVISEGESQVKKLLGSFSSELGRFVKDNSFTSESKANIHYGGRG